MTCAFAAWIAQGVRVWLHEGVQEKTFEGHPVLVLGADCSFVEPFWGIYRRKLTTSQIDVWLRFTGPCVVTWQALVAVSDGVSRGEVRRTRALLERESLSKPPWRQATQGPILKVNLPQMLSPGR